MTTLENLTAGASVWGLLASSAAMVESVQCIGSRPSKSSSTTATDAKCGFGRLIDLARAEPVAVAKHGRPVVVVMVGEEFERLKALDAPATATEAKK